METEYIAYMSIEQPVDAQLIEQTKQQIRSLVAEIAQLSKTDVAPEEFYGEFLPRIVSALAAVGGAVWTLNPQGQLALQYQINLQETRLRESEEDQAQHARLLYKTLAGSEGVLVPPHSGPGQTDPLDREAVAANPTEFLLVLGLLRTDLETVGLVEIFQRAEAAPNTQKGYLRFLMQMCELAGDFLKSHQLRHFSHRQTLWTQLEDFTRAVHASLDPRETAYTIANEGRRLIECDRVSVAIRRGKKCKIEAISGQDLFDKRSNTVRLLNKLATAVVRSGDAGVVHRRHPRSAAAGRGRRAGIRRRGAFQDGGRAAAGASGAARRKTIRRSAGKRRRRSGPWWSSKSRTAAWRRAWCSGRKWSAGTAPPRWPTPWSTRTCS